MPTKTTKPQPKKTPARKPAPKTGNAQCPICASLFRVKVGDPLPFHRRQLVRGPSIACSGSGLYVTPPPSTSSDQATTENAQAHAQQETETL